MTKRPEMDKEDIALYETFSKNLESFLTPLGFEKIKEAEPARRYYDDENYTDYFKGLLFTKGDVSLMFEYFCDTLADSSSFLCWFQTEESEHLKKEEYHTYFDIMSEKEWPFLNRIGVEKDFEQFKATLSEWVRSMEALAKKMYQDHITMFPSARKHGKRYKIVEVDDKDNIINTDVVISEDNIYTSVARFTNKIDQQSETKG